MNARIRIGISGWRYAPWRGNFYPSDLPQRLELHYASRAMSAIEINGSFYSLQRPASYAQWYADTPADFVFAVKGPRFITHMKRLREVGIPLANFFASGVFNLREKLGPILWQLPPTLKFDERRVRHFLALLPHDTAVARRLARRHDARMKGRAHLAIDAVRPLRHALEVRHESFATPECIALLREHHVALVIADTAKRYPYLEDMTADFVYLRLHGATELYRSGYGRKALERWAVRIRAWHRGEQPRDAKTIAPAAAWGVASRDVFCFFDNTDVKLRAPVDAQTLMRLLGPRSSARHARHIQSHAGRRNTAPALDRPRASGAEPVEAQ